jgi:archaellum biogenesis ATPase FlaH
MENYDLLLEEVKELIKLPPLTSVKQNIRSLRDVLAASFAGSTPETIPIPAWDFFNKTIGGGLRMREFTILCGPTGAGKTTLLANLACRLISNLTPVFIASVEVSPEAFVEKMASIVTGMSPETQKKNPTETLSLMGRSFNTTNNIFTNYETRVPHMQLLCDMLSAHKNHGTQVALIDNLNFLMEPGEDKNQLALMDKSVHDFVVFCKKIPMHVIMVMHPRKTDDGRIESEHDIKGSSTAVQEASNVILFNRIKKDADIPCDCRPEFARELKFAKIRTNGRGVGGRIILKIDPLTESYKEIRIL